MNKKTSDLSYKRELAAHLASSIKAFIFKTKQKEVVVIDHCPATGKLTCWVEGRYKITIEDILEIKKGA